MKSPLDEVHLHADPPPLRLVEGNAVRVGNSRVSLDLVVEQYEDGMTPETIVAEYDTLILADVYAVIAYYLRHRDEVRAYMNRGKQEGEALQEKIEATQQIVSRKVLLARRRAKVNDNASAGK